MVDANDLFLQTRRRIVAADERGIPLLSALLLCGKMPAFKSAFMFPLTIQAVSYCSETLDLERRRQEQRPGN